eukprot:912009_1
MGFTFFIGPFAVGTVNVADIDAHYDCVVGTPTEIPAHPGFFRCVFSDRDQMFARLQAESIVVSPGEVVGAYAGITQKETSEPNMFYCSVCRHKDRFSSRSDAESHVSNKHGGDLSVLVRFPVLYNIPTARETYIVNEESGG